MDEHLRWLDGLAQADLVRAQKTSPAELKAEARERIRRRYPELNALVGEAVHGGPPADAPANDAALPRPARRSRGSRSSSRTSRSRSRGTPFTEGSQWAAGTLAGTEEAPMRGEKAAGRFLIFDAEYATSRAAPP
ncbi:hypothetical protein [Arthrobacter sp. Soil762]|uniref:hypothetical protein n=1 Tax=Arthrobacter sp. Soil762 TaxID=1736401 RepID=UPI0006FBCC12|nr:hypothetical protein [Arthrobacter sp. Soil762]KRE74913.1 hypothetical protein ASG77_20820 [Arthrobacter sp. Soil762]